MMIDSAKLIKKIAEMENVYFDGMYKIAIIPMDSDETLSQENTMKFKICKAKHEAILDVLDAISDLMSEANKTE